MRANGTRTSFMGGEKSSTTPLSLSRTSSTTDRCMILSYIGSSTKVTADRFLGDLVHDAKVGFGRIMLSNGEYYEGEFKNDAVHGKGTFHRLDGTSVKGVWMEG